MRFFITIMLIGMSYLAQGQDIMYRLTGPSKRTWTGQSTYINSGAENTVSLTFYKNHTVEAYSNRYNKKVSTEHWILIKGDYYDDNDVVVQIGNRQYHIEFSKTNNGRDFMVMTSPVVGSDDEVVANTYFAD